MMQALLLIYNVFLFMVYCVPLILALLIFYKKKENIYLYIALLYMTFCLDELVIYLTEFIHWFSAFYKKLLFAAPTFKTIIYFLSFLCMIKIIEMILTRSLPIWLYIGLVGLIMFLLFIPGMSDSSMKLWLYYSASSVFSIALGLNGLFRYKKLPKSERTKTQQYFRYMLLIFTVMYIIVMLEDTFTLFNPDSLLYRSTRSFSEDCTRMILSAMTNIYLIKKLLSLLSTNTEDPTHKQITAATMPQPSATIVSAPNESADTTNEYSKFYLFCKEYHLTTREQDIMLLLLENKSNVEISDELIISLGTAKTHIHNIYAKLEVKKRRELQEYYHNYVAGKS